MVAGADGLPGARLAVVSEDGNAEDGLADECVGVGAPVDGVVEPRPDGSPAGPPSDDALHAARTIVPAITQPPAHHRMPAPYPGGPAPSETGRCG